MVTAAAAAACERNFLRGIALLALIDQLPGLITAKRVPRGAAALERTACKTAVLANPVILLFVSASV